MDLFLKQAVFSFRSRFSVYDCAGNEIYEAKGKLISFGRQMTLSRVGGEEIAEIRQKILSFLPSFDLFRHGEKVATVVRCITFAHPKYEVRGFDWKVEGDFFAHDYVITDGSGAEIARVGKKWFSWGDTYQIHTEAALPEKVLAVVLAIDACMAIASSAEHTN